MHPILCFARFALWLMPIALVSALAVAEAGETTVVPPKLTAADEMAQAQAERLVAFGKQAMDDSNDNPSRRVAAAVAFSQALKFYQKPDDIDTVRYLEANIFWCKKHMNPEDVKKFVAQKSGEKGVTDALATVDLVVNQEVPKEMANDYLERAEKFAKDNPNQHDQIAVRLFEVAVRFVGSQAGIRAQELSLAAHEQQVKSSKAEQEAQRKTLFTKPASQVKGTSAVPAPDAQKAAVAAIRTLYKDDYAKKKPNQKRTLANKLLTQVDASKDDSVSQYVLLMEVSELAMDTSDFHQAMVACELMATYFSGVDARTLKKTALSRARANPTAQAIITLLEKPNDPGANLVAGKYFCFEAQKWDLGLPLLANAQDADFKAMAEMEMLKPSDNSKKIELADKWYDLSKKSRSPTKEGMLARAFEWYKSAEPALAGITKERVKKRIDELDAILPMTNPDYDNLTPKQWDRLKGTMLSISAAQVRTDTKLRIAKGERLRVVPHPTETWTCDFGHGPHTADWHGDVRPRAYFYPSNDLYPISALAVQIESGTWMKPGIIEGDGRIFMGPYCGQYCTSSSGAIRVKVILIEDD